MKAQVVSEIPKDSIYSNFNIKIISFLSFSGRWEVKIDSSVLFCVFAYGDFKVLCLPYRKNTANCLH